MSLWPSGQRRRVAPVIEREMILDLHDVKMKKIRYHIIPHHISKMYHTWRMIWCHIIPITTWDSGLCISGWARLISVSGLSLIWIPPKKGVLHIPALLALLDLFFMIQRHQRKNFRVTLSISTSLPIGWTPHPGHLVVHEKMSDLEGQPRFALHSPEQALSFHSFHSAAWRETLHRPFAQCKSYHRQTNKNALICSIE